MSRGDAESRKGKKSRLGKVCPLMSHGATGAFCIEERCMLWDDQWGQCALRTLADALRYIDSTVERRGS